MKRRYKKIRYELALDIQKRLKEIVEKLKLDFIRLEDVKCIRSFGSKSRGTIARCHALGKVMQLALNRKGFYVLEFISERFDKLDEEEKIKIIIHELLHIPKSFGGGFRHHDFVNDRNINRVYLEYLEKKRFMNKTF